MQGLPLIEEGLATEPVEEGEVELGYSEHHVLIEEVQDHLGNADVAPMPMN